MTKKAEEIDPNLVEQANQVVEEKIDKHYKGQAKKEFKNRTRPDIIAVREKVLKKVIEKTQKEPTKRKSRAKNSAPNDIETYQIIPGFSKYVAKGLGGADGTPGEIIILNQFHKPMKPNIFRFYNLKDDENKTKKVAESGIFEILDRTN